MSFVSTIRRLRDEKGASQADVAEAIGIARATYASLEANRRPPNLNEIHKLAEYYQVTATDLVSGEASVVRESVMPYTFATQGTDQQPQAPDPKTNPEKLREVLLYVLESVGARPTFGEATLYRLLYFIDFGYYEKTGRPITGLTYTRNHFGPTPSVDFRAVVAGMQQNEDLEIVETKHFKNTQKKYLPLKSAQLGTVSGSELRHIDETLHRLGNKTVADLNNLIHDDAPWRIASQNKPLNYHDTTRRIDSKNSA